MIKLTDDERNEVLLLMLRLYNLEPSEEFRYYLGYYNSHIEVGKLFDIGKRDFTAFLRKLKKESDDK